MTGKDARPSEERCTDPVAVHSGYVNLDQIRFNIKEVIAFLDFSSKTQGFFVKFCYDTMVDAV